MMRVGIWKERLVSHWPLILAIIVFVLIVGAILCQIWRLTDGRFVYALDDPYIHMAMSKNLVEYGVWGVTRYSFSSSSSSIIWGLLLSMAFYLFGIQEMVPFLLNIILALGLIGVIYGIILRYGWNKRYQAGFLVIAILVLPLPTLVFIGMEHILHNVLVLGFYIVGIKLILNIKSHNQSTRRVFYLLSLLLTGVRYESIFIILIFAVVFLIKKRWDIGLTIMTLAFLTPLSYGLYSLSQGWYLIPNSIIVKGHILGYNSVKGALGTVGYWLLTHVVYGIYLLTIALTVLTLLVIRRNRKIVEGYQVKLLLILLPVLLHILLVSGNKFFRYEAYLVILTLIVLGDYVYQKLVLQSEWREWTRGFTKFIVIFFIGGAFFYYSLERAWSGLRVTAAASNNIYEQQYQMAQFLRQYYQTKIVAANDIGAINYYADIRLFDIWGLGSLDTVSQLRRQGYASFVDLGEIAKEKGVKIAIIYDDWFDDDLTVLPASWIKVGEWEITNNIVCGEDSVSFFAVDPAERDNLKSNLRQFTGRLPDSVIQRGDYLRR